MMDYRSYLGRKTVKWIEETLERVYQYKRTSPTEQKILSVFLALILPLILGYLLATYGPNPLSTKTWEACLNSSMSCQNASLFSDEAKQIILTCIEKDDCPLNEKQRLEYFNTSKEFGFFMYYNGRYAVAKYQFQNAIKLYPKEYLLYLYLGHTECKLGDYEDAVAILRKAELESPDFEVRMKSKLLSLGCLNRIAEKTGNNSMYNYVISIGKEIYPYFEYYGSNSDLDAIDEATGFAYHKLGSFSTAADYLYRKVLRNPTDAKYWDNYALDLYYAGETEKSKMAASKALQLDPNKIVSNMILNGSFISLGPMVEVYIVSINENQESIKNERRVASLQITDVEDFRQYNNTFSFSGKIEEKVCRFFGEQIVEGIVLDLNATNITIDVSQTYIYDLGHCLNQTPPQ